MRTATMVALGTAAFAAGWLTSRPEVRAARRTAVTDPLTRVANRRLLYTELERRARADEPYAVVVVDLDGFKAINDTFGHPTGDAVLATVARRMRQVVGRAGLVARSGGDEFVIVAGSPAPPVSVLLGHDLARAVACPMWVARREVVVLASVGVAHGFSGDAPRRLLHAADQAMYQAKAAGGGRVVEHDPTASLAEVVERPVLRHLAAAPRELVEAA